jgi:hypothetical protein
MMNLQETVFSIFPGCPVTGSVIDDGIFEVSGITGSMVPQNCEVLASGVFQYATSERSRRTYLVKANELLLMVRILPDASNHLCAQVMMKAVGCVQGADHLH